MLDRRLVLGQPQMSPSRSTNSASKRALTIQTTPPLQCTDTLPETIGELLDTPAATSTSTTHTNMKSHNRGAPRPRDILACSNNEDSSSTAVSEFTSFTEGMTVSPESSYRKGKQNTVSPDHSASSSCCNDDVDDDDDEQSDNSDNLDQYRAEDLFKLLEAQQSVTKCFSEIAVGMAGIIERNERKRSVQRTNSSASRRSTRSSSTTTSCASASVAASVASSQKADRVCQVVENMALRQDELAVKVVGIAVNALSRAEQAEHERKYLENRVKQLEDYIEKHRRKKKASSSGGDRRKGVQRAVSHRPPRSSSRRSRDVNELPPGFSGIIDFSHTEIDICQISSQQKAAADAHDDGASVVPEVSDNGSVRFLM